MTENKKEDQYSSFIQEFKNSNAIAQSNFIKGVDKGTDMSVLKGIKPVRYESFKKVCLECLPGDFLACIVKHKKNGTIIKYGRAIIKKPWEKDGIQGIACGLAKQFYFNDDLYEVKDIYVWKVKTMELNWEELVKELPQP